MTLQPKPLSEITTRAIHILSREMGAADTLRFFNQLTTGFGNYTEERRELFSGLSVDELISEIEKDRQGP
ncbi:MAG: hypothetical protein HC897_06750 [Thermoanaerobaculia bacterium]|nr:hypothetical protein [Thermoanaerobaculia bacterium]